MPIELPLFPLNTVLFPGAEIPLHIFESRYRLMINECYAYNQPFGIVLARPESQPLYEKPYAVGTMAEIEVLDRVEDGRMNLIARGGRRFRILSHHRQKPYLCGLVEDYDDVAEDWPDLSEVTHRASELFHSYVETLLAVAGREEIEFSLPGDSEELSHFIAHLMDIQDEEKQHMLELTSTRRRLEEEITLLRREVPFMRQILIMSQRYRENAPDKSMLN
jgi:Lon protease-like protein